MLGYLWRDLVRNPRRTMTTLVGVVLGVGLFAAVLFFGEASGATLTRRAIAPLAVDMQALLGSPPAPGLRLAERIDGPPKLPAGAGAVVRLTVANDAAVPANEVVVNDAPPAPLAYVPGSTTAGGRPLPDVGGSIPLSSGPAGIGFNLGTVRPRATVTLSYRVRATSAVRRADVPLRGRISSRENVVPAAANAPAPTPPGRLAARVGQVPGVATADRLSYVDLPPGALRAGAAAVRDPVRLFAFGPEYARHYPSVRLAAGSIRPGAAVLSAEAARALRVRQGARVSLALPGAAALGLPVSGVADLAQATPLFASRKIKKFEDFLYVPDSVILAPATFDRLVQPAFTALAARRGNVVRGLPVTEVDVLVDRSRLHADPGRAWAQTTAVGRAVSGLAPRQVTLVDNISNALAVARSDAHVGRRMFGFLGLPGLLLAAAITVFAARVLAAAQRREQALLRLRGARPGQLMALLVAKAVLLAGAGAVAGTALGVLAVGRTFGAAGLRAAGAGALARTGALAVALGMAVTALALAVPAARSSRREVNSERAELASRDVPWEQRRHLDLLLVAGAVGAEVVAYLLGGFDTPPASVSEGRGVVLPMRLLLPPLLAWVGGILLAVRVLRHGVERLPAPAPGFGGPLPGNLARSLRRRSQALATGSVGVGLVVAFAVGLAIFAASYDVAKARDARFTVGSDVRVVPSALSGKPHPTSSAAALAVDGVRAVTPVVAKPENAVLEARYNEDRRDLVALDGPGFAHTAALADAFFPGGSARAALSALAARPDGLLVDAGTAEDFSLRPGDRVRVLLARGTRQQALRPFVVVGVFTRLAGFPDGVNLVVNLATYESATGLHDADFFLLAARDPKPGALARLEAALRAGPGRSDPVVVQSSRTALNKDQSSLTALDIAGLIDLDSLFTTLMSAATVAIFVLGLLLSRRREYLTLRALGAPTGTLFGLVLGEAAVVVAGGLLAGVAVGAGTGYLLVAVLRPLFLLAPVPVVPVGHVLALALLPAAAALVSAAAATGGLRLLRPTEVLRET